MAPAVEPWWKEVHEAAQRLASTLEAAALQASRDGVYQPPPGAPTPKRTRRPGSLRHLAEIIRTHRLAPGMSMDKDIVARVLGGDLRYITEPTAVVAVAHASCLIAGVAFTDDDARRLRSACAYVAALVRDAEEADRRAPGLVPVLVEPPRPLVRTAATPLMRPGVRRPARMVVTAVAAAVVVVLISAGAAIVGASGGETPPVGATVAASTNPNCTQDAPPSGSDLLAVPHQHPSGDAKMNDWWPNDRAVEMVAYRPRQFEALVHAGRPNIWDLVILRSCLPLIAGRPYRLTLTASADVPVTVRVRVQEPNGVAMSFSTDLRLGPRPQRLDADLTGSTTSRQGELMFQVGGQATDYRLRVTDIALTGG
jgi:hypothetical protein